MVSCVPGAIVGADLRATRGGASGPARASRGALARRSVEEAAGGHEALLGREPERTPALLALSERLTSPQADPNPNPNPNP